MSAPTDTTDALEAIPDAPTRRAPGRRDRVLAHGLASDVARLHGDALLRTARRYSACAEDAHDAYQRAMELLLEHAATIDRAKAVGWMHVVVRREAGVLRRNHGRTIPFDADEVDSVYGRITPAPDEQVHAIDLAQRAGEALANLKDSEAQALCLRAQGLSYEEIAAAYGWSYTKVNRAVTEGRRAFVDHYQAVGSGVICRDTADLMPGYVAGELSARLAVKVRSHLIRCSACRSLLHAERSADAGLRALLPPAIVSVGAARTGHGWLHDHLLGPIGHFAGRLQPVGDHLIGSKIGLVAVSTLALAGGGAAVERQTHPVGHVRSLSAGLSGASAPAAAGATPPVVRIAQNATDRVRAIAASEARHARQRRAAAAHRAAVRRRIAARREFAAAGGEFAATGASTASATTRATRDVAGSASAPATDVPLTDATDDATVDVVTEPSGSGSPSHSTVTDEFSP